MHIIDLYRGIRFDDFVDCAKLANWNINNLTNEFSTDLSNTTGNGNGSRTGWHETPKSFFQRVFAGNPDDSKRTRWHSIIPFRTLVTDYIYASRRLMLAGVLRACKGCNGPMYAKSRVFCRNCGSDGYECHITSLSPERALETLENSGVKFRMSSVFPGAQQLAGIHA